MSDDALLFFAGELAELLTCVHAAGRVRYPVDRRASIKDVFEALGVPHTEVYAIRSSGREHDLSMLLEPGTTVALLPAHLTDEYPVDITRATRLRAPYPHLQFIVDENVAGVAPLLQTLGFDASRDRRWSDSDIAHISVEEQRVVLSRDRDLLKRSAILHGRLLRSQNVDNQLVEVLKHFRLTDKLSPFSRCIRCNIVTQPVAKEDIIDRLKPKTKRYFNTFKRCPSCDRIYWQGSHHDHLVRRLTALGVIPPDIAP